MKQLLSALSLAGISVAGALNPTLASAQSAATDYTSATRYDAMGRVVGTIAPDPDGSGPLKYLATRTTYDARGNATKVETGELQNWKSENILPANWGADFNSYIHSTVETTYDAMNRKLTEKVIGSNNTAVSLTQYSYDNRGRLECTAVRMNRARFNNLPSSACTLGVEGSDGPDRITRTYYDAAGQVLQIRKAHATNEEISEVTYDYTYNGHIESVVDANGNKATYEYDGFDRLYRWYFPNENGSNSFDPTTTSIAGSTTPTGQDYEQYSYDANGNRLRLRKRDGTVIYYEYDALNRLTKKDLPSRTGLSSTHRRDVLYSYDLRGLQTEARFLSRTGDGVVTNYDGFGRMLSEEQIHSGSSWTVSSAYDANGNRTQITHPDAAYWRYEYDAINRLDLVRQQTSQLGVFEYNARGLVEGRVWTNQTTSANRTDLAYDSVGRLASLSIDLDSTGSDVRWGFTRNPASQIHTEDQDNPDYTWDGHPESDVNRSYTVNGLNQYTAVGPDAFCYDANGNLTADGEHVYQYDIENRLVQKRVQGAGNTNCDALAYTGTLKAQLYYDPLGRLYQIADGSLGTQRFVYDGDALVAEYDGSNAMQRRYVHGANAGADDPLIWYEGSGTGSSARRYLHADPRGSIVAITDKSGASIATNAYDEYGIPDSASLANDGSCTDTLSAKGRFRYTGQLLIPELCMFYYKARIYSFKLGRFMQTDPIGYEDQFNLYAYVGNDPINAVDPSGQCGSKINGNSNPFCKSTGHQTGDESDLGNELYEGILDRGEGISEELRDQIVTSYELGLHGEDWVVEQLEAEGFDIVARQLYVWTVDLKLRIVDIVAKKNDQLVFVEVKVNGGRYSGSQIKKDVSIGINGGYVNPNSPAATRYFRSGSDAGAPWVGPTETKLVRVRCRYLGYSCRMQ